MTAECWEEMRSKEVDASIFDQRWARKLCQSACFPTDGTKIFNYNTKSKELLTNRKPIEALSSA
jgi:hypothetical protein